MTRHTSLVLRAVLATALASSASRAQQTDSLLRAALAWRAIGPANMGGRITDIEGLPSPSRTFYVVTAAGGVFKTTNAGTTFRPVFDSARVASGGDIAIAPGDSNTLYYGTGEPNTRNSISPGGGVFRSRDGGQTWTFVGLAETQHIGRIVVDPRDPNVVYVAALGHAWGPNRERGLYKSTDGGASWSLVKYVSDRAGFVDVQLDPSNPDVVWASSYERVRGPYFFTSGGPGSALWKSTDAGRTWREIVGGGFPATMKGRISLDISRSNPRVMYAMVEADTVHTGSRDTTRTPQVRPSGLYRSADAGATWERTNGANVRPFYYSQVRVDPSRPDRVYFTSTPVLFSDDGGRTARRATIGLHVDQHALWIDPVDPAHFVVGNDGGVAQTWDRGGNYDFLNVLPIGQFYAVSYDMAVPYSVCGGLQDNGTWCGPSRRRSGPITNAMWANVGGGDGFQTAQDPTDPDIVYVESQGGNMSRVNRATGERVSLVRPSWRSRYRQFEDSLLVVRGDTTQPVSAATERRLEALRRRQRGDSTESDLRFNWNTPFFLSPHNPRVFYAAANKVLRSTNRGENLTVISPDLTTRDSLRIRVSTRTTGGITPDVTGAETHGTITALAESPRRAGLLYAGTDDGNVWVSPNDGAVWENITGRFPGLPRRTWVSRIEPSAFDTTVFYVTFDGHRTNDFTPYVYATSDGGRSFRSLADSLPHGGPDFVHVIREDPHNPDLLFVGTDVGVYVTTDRGGHWHRFMRGMPTVPVHDLRIHPRDHEIIAGTHGRSLYIADVAPLEQLRDSLRRRDVVFFTPRTAYAFTQPPVEGQATGQKVFEAASPPYGADLWYSLAQDHGPRAQLVITDAAGDTVRTLTGPATAGLHRITWDLRGRSARPTPLSPAGIRDSVRRARRLATVLDSLGKSGTLTAAQIQRLRAATADGTMQGLQQLLGGGGSGRGSPRGAFVARPGEGPLPRSARPHQEEREGDAGEIDPGEWGTISQLLRGAIGEGTGEGGGAPLVSTGEYLATLIVGPERARQRLRVERLTAGTTAGLGDAEREDGPDSAEP